MTANSAFVEKSVITFSLFAAFPLVFLDKDALGFRRFAWLGAAFCGLVVQFFFDPLQEELAQSLDRATMALVSVSVVPHFMKFYKGNFWLGLAMVPPFFLVVHLATQGQLDEQEYWRLRAFLHMAVFILPYFNHLPSPPDPPEPETETIMEEKVVQKKTKAKSSGKKTNKNKQ